MGDEEKRGKKDEKGKEGKIETKDYWTILGILASGVQWEDIRCERDGRGQRYLVFVFGEGEAKVVYEKCIRGEELMVDLWKVEQASEKFKKLLLHFGIKR